MKRIIQLLIRRGRQKARAMRQRQTHRKYLKKFQGVRTSGGSGVEI